MDKASETQLKNIEKKTGKTLQEFQTLLHQSGLQKHSEMRQLLMDQFGLGYGDANAMVHFALKTDGTSAAEAKGASTDDVLDEIYSGAKAGLRPVHDKLMESINRMGEFEIAPKKGYVSLRRTKQFAMLGPGTKGRFEVGLNMKGLEGTDRLIAQPPGGMCQYKVFLTNAGEVDGELIDWIKQAYDSAG